MIAKNLLSKEIPFLIPTDDGNRALDIMENYMVSNLPIVDGKSFEGIISMDDIFNFDLFNVVLKDFKKPVNRSFVYDNQHIFDVIKVMALYQSSILPVLNGKSNFIGIITQKSLLDNLAEILCIKEDGYHLKFSMNSNDFSATEISNIVEKNEGKLLSLYIDDNKTPEINVYLKIYTKDIESIMQSFDRYKYEVILLNKEENDYSDFYQERMDNFMNYLNI
ncbi:MAG: CBS domain-containing protein [Bacteroidales bacterium]|nr:CBS domain-containing protein [Bacteroidales bacterium]